MTANDILALMVERDIMTQRLLDAKERHPGAYSVAIATMDSKHAIEVKAAERARKQAARRRA